MTFNVGDRVRVISNAVYANHKLLNLTGTILDGHENGQFPVRFDESVPTVMHDCRGKCEKGHGWWVFEFDLTLIEPETLPIDQLELAWSDLIDQADEGHEPTEHDREFFVAGWHAAMRHKQ